MASPVDTSVKFAQSNMVGAPVINGQSGSRIAAIKAFAVTGFGLKSVDAGGAISAGKCRLSFGSGASAAVVNSVILVAGATPAALNGEQKVTAVASGWVEFATALPDGAVSGSVSFKIAPLGWEEVYTKTNVSVFRPTDPAASRPYLRIDDSNATYAIVQMYESMSDVDTGINGTAARNWVGRTAASANAVGWVMAGDSQGLHIGMAPYSASAVPEDVPNLLYYFGDCISDRSGDAYPGLLMGNSDTSATNVSGSIFAGAASNAQVMRIASGLGGVAVATVSNELLVDAVSGSTPTYGVFPSRAAQALFLTRVIVADGGSFAANGRRGVVPGVYHVPQSAVVSVYNRTGMQEMGTGDYQGKVMLAVGAAPNASNPNNGVGFIDITGPWRLHP